MAHEVSTGIISADIRRNRSEVHELACRIHGGREMARRPKVFERGTIEASLRKQGVPENRIGETISFMRLVIPLAIVHAGEEGIVDSWEEVMTECGLADTVWVKLMAPHVVRWASDCLEEFKNKRVGNSEE